MARTQKDHPLSKWRKDNGAVTLQALADDIGCTQSFLSQVEAGQKQPSLTMAMKLRERTGLSLESFARQTEGVAQ